MESVPVTSCKPLKEKIPTQKEWTFSIGRAYGCRLDLKGTDLQVDEISLTWEASKGIVWVANVADGYKEDGDDIAQPDTWTKLSSGGKFTLKDNEIKVLIFANLDIENSLSFTVKDPAQFPEEKEEETTPNSASYMMIATTTIAYIASLILM